MPAARSIVPAPRTDCHFHVFDAGGGVSSARYVPRYAATLDEWEARAGAHGVARGVLVQPSFLGSDNSLLLREIRARPGALRGVAVVDPHATAFQLGALDLAGVRALRLNLSGVEGALSVCDRFAPLWDDVLRIGWHVEVHTDAGALPAVLARLPSAVPVVADHMGKPATLSADDATFACLAARSRHAPVHVKLSGAYRQAIPEQAGAIARRWRDELGEGALLWGSDWPFTNHEATADYAQVFGTLSEWVGPEAAQAALEHNPARVYFAR